MSGFNISKGFHEYILARFLGSQRILIKLLIYFNLSHPVKLDSPVETPGCLASKEQTL